MGLFPVLSEGRGGGGGQDMGSGTVSPTSLSISRFLSPGRSAHPRTLAMGSPSAREGSGWCSVKILHSPGLEEADPGGGHTLPRARGAEAGLPLGCDLEGFHCSERV